MASTTATLLKPISMANGCLTSHPTLFTTKASYPFISIPSKPIKALQITSSSSFASWVSLKKKNSSSSVISLVAQTSDWAQQEKQEGVVAEEELVAEGEEEGEEESGFEEGEEESGLEEGEDESGFEEGDEVEDDGNEESYTEPPEEAKLFVGNLPYDIDSEKLAGLFVDVGTVEVAEVIYNRETDQSRGFGFVTMSTVEEAEKGVEMLNRYDAGGRLLTVNKAAPRGTRPERPAREYGPTFRLYVGNLSWQVDDARLEQVFSEHGKVVEARVVYDRETGRSRGFGFVTMTSQTELDDAINALDGQDLDGRAMRVNVAEERPPRRNF